MAAQVAEAVASLKSRSAGQGQTLVTRERVIAPPDRAVTVSDAQLIEYFKGGSCTGPL